MMYDILFLQGAGAAAIEEEKPIIKQLQVALGNTVRIHHPEMPDADNPKAEAWKKAIEGAIEGIKNPLIVVGHSLGGSVLLQLLSQAPPSENLIGIVLMAIPFWGGEDWDSSEFQLDEKAGETLKNVKNIYIYHSHDDEVVDFSHHEKYQQLLPSAKSIQLKEVDHSFTGATVQLIQDIQTIIEEYKRNKQQEELKEKGSQENESQKAEKQKAEQKEPPKG